MNKLSLIDKAVPGIVLLLAGCLLASCSNRATEDTEKQKIIDSPSVKWGTTVYIVPGKKEAEGVKAMMEAEGFKKINEWGDHLNKAGRYEETKNYNLAEGEYTKALQLSPNKTDEGAARIGLSRIYEVTDRYQLAIQQIDWLLSRDLRKDVLERLRLRKQKLEKLLSEQTSATPTNPSSAVQK